MLELYHNDMSVCSQKVRMVLAEKGLEWKGHNLNLRAGDQFTQEFLKLNPKAVVPVLVHNSRAITESNAIVAYLDEVFQQPPLMPSTAAGRAVVRKWLLWLDAGLHLQIAFISFAIAFRHILLATRNTPETLEQHFTSIPDYGISMAIRELVSNGLDSKLLQIAVINYESLLTDMERVLGEQKWLVGDRLSLADIAYAPYITRLEQLQLQHWWDERPGLAAWLQRIKDTNGYDRGVTKWLNPKILPLMKEQGQAAQGRIREILKHEALNLSCDQP